MNLKKHICFVLALLILFINSSAAIVLHFCGNNFAYVGLAYSNTIKNKEIETCCAEKAKENKNCCDEKEIKSSNKIDYSLLKNYQINFLEFVFPKKTNITFTCLKNYFTFSKKLFYYCNSNAPPIYKLNKQLIFYA